MQKSLQIESEGSKLLLKFSSELTLQHLTTVQHEIERSSLRDITEIVFDCKELDYIDTSAALYINRYIQKLQKYKIEYKFLHLKPLHKETLNLVAKNMQEVQDINYTPKEITFLENIGKKSYYFIDGLRSFLYFFGRLFSSNIRSIISIKSIRFKEIAFEINESAIKALGIIALTSFLIGLVVAYQSAYQLKIYGANIFIVDMLGISIFRELAPLITAIVIAGRSGSAYAAQIGAMKITQELDAMETMGFEPFRFLVLPRIIALMITMPILIFVADIMAIFGGMLIANIDLHITPSLFIDRLNEVVAVKHFIVGIIKGPFFAFLIASIGIYRGLMVKDDTQSIGFNTTKSVVESIFAVIVCDAIFSIAFTNLGI
jgi:phospholipid/cholesterol/gamma-HCH transport system permease protein